MGDDRMPSLIEQADANGWKAGLFSFGKAESERAAHFNCSIIELPEPAPHKSNDEFLADRVAAATTAPAKRLWLIVRRAEFDGSDPFGHNSLYAAKLRDDLTPEFLEKMPFLDAQTQEHFEDPRAVALPGTRRVFVGACNFIWYGNGDWTGAHQTLGVFDVGDDDTWTCIKRHNPEIGGNSAIVDERGKRHEKNWLWFFADGKLSVLYHSNPWRVAQFGRDFNDAHPFEIPGVSWEHGEIRGGTPPVLAPAPDPQDGALFYTFFHSSVPWLGRFRRYHMGCIAFDAAPPFTPRYMTTEPLLTGSQRDPWAPKKPLVVFPCGALLRGDDWLVTYGVNDLKCGYAQIPHVDLIARMVPIGGNTLSGGVKAREARIAEDGRAGDRPTNDSPARRSSDLPAQSTSTHAKTRVTSKQCRTKQKGGDNDNGRIRSNPERAAADSRPAAATADSTAEHAGQGRVANGTAGVPSAAPSPDDVSPSVGDEIRFHVAQLATLASNNNRRGRILKELRKNKLVPLR